MGTALLMGRREVLKAMAATLMVSVALPAMAEEAPRKGGTLNVRLNADIRATNGIQRDANTDTVMHQIFETLVGYRTDLSIGPVLAESWKVSEDGKTYTFTLREGAVYHNGDKVIAADVKWNWERRMDPANEWLFVTSFDGTQGLKVESVEAVDERNVTFKLNAPNALVQESVRAYYKTWYADLTTQLPTVADGMITVPPGPGHGVDLAEDLDRKFTVRRRSSKTS